MAAIGGELCMEGLWRGWRFAVIGMKKLEDICSVKAYVLSSNGNACVLPIPLIIFDWFRYSRRHNV